MFNSCAKCSSYGGLACDSFRSRRFTFKSNVIDIAWHVHERFKLPRNNRRRTKPQRLCGRHSVSNLSNFSRAVGGVERLCRHITINSRLPFYLTCSLLETRNHDLCVRVVECLVLTACISWTFCRRGRMIKKLLTTPSQGRDQNDAAGPSQSDLF